MNALKKISYFWKIAKNEVQNETLYFLLNINYFTGRIFMYGGLFSCYDSLFSISYHISSYFLSGNKKKIYKATVEFETFSYPGIPYRILKLNSPVC